MVEFQLIMYKWPNDNTSGFSEEKILRSSDKAYVILRDLIVSLELKPGSIVNEQELASRLKLGRMPVREALARLAVEQFVEILQRRGAMIAPITLEGASELFEAREVIECGIARIAAVRITDDQLEKLKEVIFAVDHDRDSSDFENFLAHDFEIHSFLGRTIRDTNLRELSDRLLRHNLRFWRSYWSSRPALKISMVSHDDLLKSLMDHDPIAAEAAMRSHLEDAKTLLRNSMWSEES